MCWLAINMLEYLGGSEVKTIERPRTRGKKAEPSQRDGTRAKGCSVADVESNRRYGVLDRRSSTRSQGAGGTPGDQSRSTRVRKVTGGGGNEKEK